jgi:Ca2+-transporting ATPase
VLSLLQGCVVLVVVLAVYLYALSRGLGEPEVRAMTFITIVVANLFLILTNRSWTETIISTLRSPNRALLGVFAGTLVCLSLVVYLPPLRDLFRFGPVMPSDLILCSGAGMLSVVWFEIFKYRNKLNAAQDRMTG